MKEKMLKFLDENPNPIYFEEKELIREFIETFFNSYQPERSKREDAKIYKGKLPDKLNWCNPTTL